MTTGCVTRIATALTRCGPPNRNQPRSEIHAPAIRQFDVAIHQRTTILSPVAFYDVFGPGGQAAGQLSWLWHWNIPSFRGRVASSMRRVRFGSRSLSRCTQCPQTNPVIRAQKSPTRGGTPSGAPSALSLTAAASYDFRGSTTGQSQSHSIRIEYSP